jgi:hypothetical protein
MHSPGEPLRLRCNPEEARTGTIYVQGEISRLNFYRAQENTDELGAGCQRDRPISNVTVMQTGHQHH